MLKTIFFELCDASIIMSYIPGFGQLISKHDRWKKTHHYQLIEPRFFMRIPYNWSFDQYHSGKSNEGTWFYELNMKGFFHRSCLEISYPKPGMYDMMIKASQSSKNIGFNIIFVFYGRNTKFVFLPKYFRINNTCMCDTCF